MKKVDPKRHAERMAAKQKIMQARPAMQHAVVTGRYAPEQLIELADTVTEMKVVKHAFKEQGVRAQRGIEL